MNTFSWSRALTVLLLFVVASLAVGCAPPLSRDQFDPHRQAKQQELLNWMQEDRR
ncbi:hypothetical protein [Desulfolutivibrio sulfoxidireducens]|uniref:hypothetical protein n=1 Tax=Desulfolutivibrio sulfoxidireducens TaxID=2773299 RepID=UPI00159E5450|nr:hypothetical protein [Desulfolutivibrio sulfoxidireducens]